MCCTAPLSNEEKLESGGGARKDSSKWRHHLNGMLHCTSPCRGQVDLALEDVVKADKGSKGRGGGRGGGGGGGGVLRGRGGGGNRGARMAAPYQVRASTLAESLSILRAHRPLPLCARASAPSPIASLFGSLILAGLSRL